MTSDLLFSSAHIKTVISKALYSGNIRESDYLIYDVDDKIFSVNSFGVSNGHNRIGFEIGHFVDFDEDCPLINDEAIAILSQMLKDGLLDL